MKPIHTLLLAVICTCSVWGANAQFAPQAGISGSTAIHKSSPYIIGWATKADLNRGYINIADKSLGLTSTGDESSATGAPDGDVVSLGDSGVITLSFDQHIQNGSGPDFVVFENGFANPTDPELAFLELAFVEVSSDGEHFFRFPATSNTPLDSQVKGAGEYMNTRLIHNLAGKYVSGYGTPFDLEDLKGETGLNINAISHVRIVDVTGAINEAIAQKDHTGQIINDPYPTPFPTGGFDLDAVGILNGSAAGIRDQLQTAISMYPNPAEHFLYLNIQETMLSGNAFIIITDIRGKVVTAQKAQTRNTIYIGNYLPGLYLIGIQQQNHVQWIGKCTKI